MRTFRDFMERALYDPELGYYARRQPRADFYTAAELHPAFAGVLGRDVSRRLEDLRRARIPESPKVVEMGAGEGLLAEQLLANLPEGTPYVLIERCRPLLERALARLQEKGFSLEGYQTLEELPPCAGIFLSNELVDAFPVHVLEFSDGRVQELYVDGSGAERLGELSTPTLAAHALRLPEALEEGARHAVNLDAERWLGTVAGRLTSGAIMTIDYGKRFGCSPNAPRAFFRHSQPRELTKRMGEQDLTASVDFDGLISTGERMGLKVEFYGSLSRFLIDNGIADWLPTGDSIADVISRSQIKTLFHPEGMGEAFKVLIQSPRRGLPS